MHLCAKMQEVVFLELKKYIADLQKKITTIEDLTGFYYIGYVTSSYLDSIVNSTRTNFEYDDTRGKYLYTELEKILWFPQ